MARAARTRSTWPALAITKSPVSKGVFGPFGKRPNVACEGWFSGDVLISNVLFCARNGWLWYVDVYRAQGAGCCSSARGRVLCCSARARVAAGFSGGSHFRSAHPTINMAGHGTPYTSTALTDHGMQTTECAAAARLRCLCLPRVLLFGLP